MKLLTTHDKLPTTNYSLQPKRGFTLIEILVVIGIIVVLVTISAISYVPIQKKARDVKRRNDLKQISMALEMYASNNSGLYPVTTGNPQCYLNWCGSCSSYAVSNSYVPNLVPQYIQKLPHDPKEGIPNDLNLSCQSISSTCYFYVSDGKDYKIVANCGAEIPVNPQDPFYDQNPQRSSYALQISTDGAIGW